MEFFFFIFQYSPGGEDQSGTVVLETRSKSEALLKSESKSGSKDRQLFTLLAKEPISKQQSPDTSHVVHAQTSSGGEVLQMESSATTRIIIPEGVTVGEEILVLLENPAATAKQQHKQEATS